MYHTVSQLLNNPRSLVYLNERYMKETFKFKDYDIQFLKLFWQPDFDESWILLDEPFIETWLIDGTNLNLTQLYQQLLFTMFHKDVDYKLSFEANPESMYMVKGHCLKDLCMCNKFFRDLFIRLSHVAHMLVLIKSIDDNSTQINLKKTSKQIETLSQKIDNLTFHVEEIVGERVAELSARIIPDTRCEEVVNIIRLPRMNEETVRPFHLRGAGYVVIRCLRKNYNKHLARVRSYGSVIEEVFDSPVANEGVDVVRALRDAGVKTYKTNGVASCDHFDLVEKVKAILKIEDMIS